MFDWKAITAQLAVTVLVALVATLWAMEKQSAINGERLTELQQQVSLLRQRVISLEHK